MQPADAAGPPQPITEERARILFGSPRKGEDVEVFLERLLKEMTDAGLWNPDGTFNVEAMMNLQEKGRKKAFRLRGE